MCALIFALASTKWSNYDPNGQIMKWSNYDPNEAKMDINQTACSYLKQFDIEDNVILSVCNTNRHIVLDVYTLLLLLVALC